MHDDADAAQARAAFEPPQDVVAQVERLFGNRQNEIARLQYEWLAGCT